MPFYLRKASAAAHILAMESQKAAGERFIISEKEIWLIWYDDKTNGATDLSWEVYIRR